MTKNNIMNYEDIVVFLAPYLKERKFSLELGPTMYDPADFILKAKLIINGEEVSKINMETVQDKISLGK